jgi:hypothetical protein
VNKKKQKNFLSSPGSTLEHARWRATGSKGTKVFCFFFSKKKALAFLSLAFLPPIPRIFVLQRKILRRCRIASAGNSFM